MFTRRKKTLFIVLAAQRIECGVWEAGQWLPDSVLDSPIDPVQRTEAPIAALLAALTRIEGSLQQWRDAISAEALAGIRSVRVLVADCWISTTGTPWSPSLMNRASSDAFARGQLSAAGLDVALDDTVRLDDAAYGQPRLAVAYSALLLQALRAFAERLQARLDSVLPLGVAAWESARGDISGGGQKASQVLAIWDEGMVTFVQSREGLADVSTRFDIDCLAVQTPIAIRSLLNYWERMRLRDPQLERVENLHVLFLDRDVEPPFDEERNVVVMKFPRPVLAPSPSIRLLLAMTMSSMRHPVDAIPPAAVITTTRCTIGVVALIAAIAISQAWRLTAEVRKQERHAAALSASLKPVVRAVVPSREEQSRIQAVNGAIRQLNLPIESLLRALQPPRDIRVAVLGFDVTGGADKRADDAGSGIKIIAEAPTGAEMARYVSYVSERRPFSGAYLMRHEIVESAPERPYRFTVEATWKE
jgi:hypothetical protein